jgi:glutathione S-transferase
VFLRSSYECGDKKPTMSGHCTGSFLHGRRPQSDNVTVADFVVAHTLDCANEDQLLEGFPRLLDYMKRMYSRPNAPPRIAEAFATRKP